MVIAGYTGDEVRGILNTTIESTYGRNSVQAKILMDMGANVVRSHQLLLLPDSEMYAKEYRQKYKIESRYRLQPKCFGNYNLYGESFSCAEVDELCVTNNMDPNRHKQST